MSTIVTRAGKGSALSFAEVDGNFTNLNTDKLESNTSTSVDSEIALFSGTGGKTFKRATTTGLLKASSGVIAAAVADTDYLTPPSGTAILKANSGGALANASAGTDYLAPPSGTAILKANSGGALANASAGTDYVAPGTATTFTADQTFNSTRLKLAGSTSGTTTLNATAVAGTTTITFPAVTDTVAVLGATQTFSGSITFSANTVFSSTGALTVSKGTTGERPTPVTGMIRYNTSTNLFEGYSGSSPSWQSLGSGGGGGGTGGSGGNIVLSNLFGGF